MFRQSASRMVQSLNKNKTTSLLRNTRQFSAPAAGEPVTSPYKLVDTMSKAVFVVFPAIFVYANWCIWVEHVEEYEAGHIHNNPDYPFNRIVDKAFPWKKKGTAFSGGIYGKLPNDPYAK